MMRDPSSVELLVEKFGMSQISLELRLKAVRIVEDES